MEDPVDTAGAHLGPTAASGTAATCLVAALCAFGLSVVFARPLLAMQLTDGLSVYLLLMAVLAVGAWLLTFAFMRQQAARRGADGA